MKKSRLLGAVCACITTFVTVSANSALVGRDLDGNLTTAEAYYDDVADLTWLANANAAVGSAYDTLSPGSGRMYWADANTWAAGLDINGATGWRLPDTVDVGNDGATYTNMFQGVDYGYNITTHSEMSNMFYNVLGNTAYYDTSGTLTGCTTPNYCLTNTGPFSNLQSDFYWSSTEYADTTSAWDFNFYDGYQDYHPKDAINHAWAVQSGNIGAAVVPVPVAAWLFGSGLLGLVGMARKKAA